MQNLSFAYKTVGNYDKSVDLLNAILKLYPNREETQFALGHTLLAMGNFEQGWAQHDRFLVRTNRYSKELKDWIKNGTLQGKHILLRQEGGWRYYSMDTVRQTAQRCRSLYYCLRPPISDQASIQMSIY